MTQKIFIGVAWPYANGPLHLGHIAGAYLPADIFARYHRLKGNSVLMVSGSDQHGTPITIAANQEATTPQEVASRYHRQFLESWDKLGISFDLFTTTGTENHAAVVHDIFLTLLGRDHIYKETLPQAYCPKCMRFLPDRYVHGTCSFCRSVRARGDQCEACGKPLNAAELIRPQCSICGTPPEFRDSEHFFLRLSAFEQPLLEWIRRQKHWRKNVQNFSVRFIEGGLKDRAITRDIEWGVSVPQPGFENKRIYVWFEAVIGYLSASKEWAKSMGDADAWRAFWTGDSKSYYFIGKDNIPFHTIIWPSMLMGYGGLGLPFDVPSNEFLTIEGDKLSTSRRWAVWVPDFLERYDPDPLRYYLSANMPETGDADFSWPEFVRRNNGELVGTYGNLSHRVLTFIQRNYQGMVPVAGEIDERGEKLIEFTRLTLETVDNLLSQCRFRESVRSIMALAQDANRYLDEKAPWKAFRTDPASAGTSLYVVLVVLSGLKTMLYPFLPFSSLKLHSMLGYESRLEDSGWTLERPEQGRKLPAPIALFVKLDEKIADEELERMRLAAAPAAT
ncbi:MAG: methionine--tRNA ligase [Dehalococcoidia bacterium]|nr:methionine--tRNA ligase [Dehalococcoidia bacterium]